MEKPWPDLNSKPSYELWTSNLTFMSPSLLICKMGIIIPISLSVYMRVTGSAYLQLLVFNKLLDITRINALTCDLEGSLDKPLLNSPE